MLGLYLHRDSPVHHWTASVKLGGLLLVTLAVLAAPGAWGAAAAGLLAVGLVGLARLPVVPVARSLWPVLLMLALLFAVQVPFGELSWGEAMVAAARFLALVLLATVVTMTTRVTEMVDLFERVFALARPLGVDPAKLALMLALTIRFIPLLVEQVREIRQAQQARGVERSMAALFVPLLVKVLTLADDLTAALEARGYDPADGSNGRKV